MNVDSELMRYVEGQGHPSTVIFVSLLSLSILAACAFALLRPWPPGIMDGLLFLLVAAICLAFGGGVVWFGGRQSEFRIDRRAGEVTEQVRFLGLGRIRRWKLHDFHTAQVRQVRLRDRAQEDRSRRPGSLSVDGSGPDDAYVLRLIGPSAEVRIRSWTDVLEAESYAREVATFGGWQAKRLGYTNHVEHNVDGVRTKSIVTIVEGENVIGPEATR